MLLGGAWRPARTDRPTRGTAASAPLPSDGSERSISGLWRGGLGHPISSKETPPSEWGLKVLARQFYDPSSLGPTAGGGGSEVMGAVRSKFRTLPEAPAASARGRVSLLGCCEQMTRVHHNALSRKTKF